MRIFSVSSRDRIDLFSVLLGLFPEPWGAVRVGDGRPGWLAPCPCSLMESPLSCRIPSPGEGGHRSFMGVEARAGQADLQTWLWWEADAMDRGGLRLGCCQPHQEPCREDRKVPATDLEKKLSGFWPVGGSGTLHSTCAHSPTPVPSPSLGSWLKMPCAQTFWIRIWWSTTPRWLVCLGEFEGHCFPQVWSALIWAFWGVWTGAPLSFVASLTNIHSVSPHTISSIWKFVRHI